MKIFFRSCFLIATCGCLGTGTTNTGATDTYPLVRVDGVAIPITLSDSSGKSVQVVHGTLTTYSSSVSCDYKVDFSDGKSLSGTKTCSLVSDVQVVFDGLQFSLDAADVGGPVGGHLYAFKTNTGKPCFQGVLCANPGGATDRASDTFRVRGSESGDAASRRTVE